MTMSAALKAESGKVKQVKLLEEKLRAKLLPLFEEWGNGGNGTERKLLVQPSVVHLRIISGGARFWGGALAGESHIDMDLKLVDAGSGEVVGAPRINKASGAFGGAWSVGASDRNLLDYIVAISQKYLVANYQPR